jgi:hypothetical protein
MLRRVTRHAFAHPGITTLSVAYVACSSECVQHRPVHACFAATPHAVAAFRLAASSSSSSSSLAKSVVGKVEDYDAVDALTVQRDASRRIVKIATHDASEKMMALISNISTLRHLDLSHSRNLDSASFKHIFKIGSLEHLNLGFCAGPFDFSQISQLRALKTLHLEHDAWYEYDLRDQDAAHIAELKSLRELNVSTRLVSGRVMAHICKLRKLRKLNLGRCAYASDQDLRQSMKHIRQLTELRKLDLDDFSNDNASLEHIGTLSKLEWLNVSMGKNVSDRGFRQLSHLTALRWLSIGRPYFNDRISCSAVGKMKLPALKHLRLSGARKGEYSNDAVARFKRAHPGCDVRVVEEAVDEEEDVGVDQLHEEQGADVVSKQRGRRHKKRPRRNKHWPRGVTLI